ncbi:YlbD family protein [Peribacillus glennii]|uniref:Cytosolic protein n=1 Tax=Peribacillus glennii TaxID=2303991 RepID=A0A372LC00_9BACI|nr:YlbD family protein [Peribacillus glennii]RFU63396.1 cytosolic protein [Peribacillus glennii]
MAQKKGRTSVEKFKAFVKKHPKLRQEVKDGNYTWQELFEEWQLFGGDHEQWEEYKAKDGVGTRQEEPEKGKSIETNQTIKTSQMNKTDFLALLLQSVKNLDVNQVQQYISSANQALGAIQGIISSFQGEKPKNEEEVQEQKPKSNPFVFRKD